MVRNKICKLFLFIEIIMLFGDALASESLITECRVIKSIWSGFKSNINGADIITNKKIIDQFIIEEKETKERYLLAMNKNVVNIYHYDEGNPAVSWNAIDENDKISILHNDLSDLVVQLDCSGPGITKQIYYFQLDNNGNGKMTMTNLRSNSLANNQSLYFCRCYGITN